MNAARTRPKSAGTRHRRLTAADWLNAARTELIRNGIHAVKADRLARTLGVTRGSFYWHYTSLKELHDALLASWVATNTEPFKRVLKFGRDGREQFLAIITLWVKEEEYDPKFDTSVREWARISPHVARVVRRADAERIEVLQKIFRELGYARNEALVRARIAYFHQVGYYTLGIVESDAARRKLRDYYIRALLGER